MDFGTAIRMIHPVKPPEQTPGYLLEHMLRECRPCHFERTEEVVAWLIDELPSSKRRKEQKRKSSFTPPAAD